MSRAFPLLAGPVILLALAACEPVPATGGGAGAAPRGIVTVPESVSSIAAPYQDLTTARLRVDDGCYWYMHRGVVETTELPLRTTNGSPICTRPAS